MIEERAPGEAVTETSRFPCLQEREQLRGNAALIAADLLLFGLWFGGLVLIGGLVAPVAFGVIRHSAAVAGGVAGQKALAGAVVGGSLRVYNVIAAVCGLWLTARMWRLSVGAFHSMYGRFVVTLLPTLVLTITTVQALVLFPAIDHARILGRMRLFDRLHHGYVMLADAQMALTLAFAGCYGWLLSRRMTV